MNVEHRTSNDEIALLRQLINWQNTLFKIRCSMFDVGRSSFKTTQHLWIRDHSSEDMRG